jgi:hypothetical protein
VVLAGCGFDAVFGGDYGARWWWRGSVVTTGFGQMRGAPSYVRGPRLHKSVYRGSGSTLVIAS